MPNLPVRSLEKVQQQFLPQILVFQPAAICTAAQSLRKTFQAGRAPPRSPVLRNVHHRLDDPANLGRLLARADHRRHLTEERCTGVRLFRGKLPRSLKELWRPFGRSAQSRDLHPGVFDVPGQQPVLRGAGCGSADATERTQKLKLDPRIGVVLQLQNLVEQARTGQQWLRQDNCVLAHTGIGVIKRFSDQLGVELVKAE